MSETNHHAKEVLYVIVCAAPPAQEIQNFVSLAKASGWVVCVIATPQATKFVDVPLLEQLTSYPVRSNYKHPQEPDVLPRADAIVILPATFNTINKWALGITDTLALGLLCEYLGLRKPILAVPHVSTDELGQHPAFSKSVALLRECGVHILYEPERYPPANTVPLQVVFDELGKMIKLVV